MCCAIGELRQLCRPDRNADLVDFLLYFHLASQKRTDYEDQKCLSLDNVPSHPSLLISHDSVNVATNH